MGGHLTSNFNPNSTTYIYLNSENVPNTAYDNINTKARKSNKTTKKFKKEKKELLM